jgi:hypothetical protein
MGLCPRSRLSGAVRSASVSTSQAAGALIPDNTQQPWRDYVRTTSNERGEGHAAVRSEA